MPTKLSEYENNVECNAIEITYDQLISDWSSLFRNDRIKFYYNLDKIHNYDEAPKHYLAVFSVLSEALLEIKIRLNEQLHSHEGLGIYSKKYLMSEFKCISKTLKKINKEVLQECIYSHPK